MDLAAIATSIVSTLSPYLVIVGEKSAEAIAKKVPDATERLFHYISEKFAGHPSASEALEKLSQAPTNGDRQATLTRKLIEIMEEDKIFAKDVSDLLSDSTGRNINTVNAGDAATIIQQTGHGNVANIR